MRFTGISVLFMFLLCGTTFAQDDVGTLLSELDRLLAEAHAHSVAAESADEVAAVKEHADGVFAAIWGRPSGLADGSTGAAALHGWKTRWQTTGEEFDEAHVERHGRRPPEADDVSVLGLMGRARHLRGILVARHEADPSQAHLPHVIHSLNNVIGWMRLDDGVTKAENQPRVDLTYMWDAPSEFWKSSADTGWIHEAFAQALNILKTNYQGDVALARAHAADMTALLAKCRSGVDANGDGSVAPVLMEGGLDTALTHAGYAGLMQ